MSLAWVFRAFSRLFRVAIRVVLVVLFSRAWAVSASFLSWCWALAFRFMKGKLIAAPNWA